MLSLFWFSLGSKYLFTFTIVYKINEKLRRKQDRIEWNKQQNKINKYNYINPPPKINEELSTTSISNDMISKLCYFNPPELE